MAAVVGRHDGCRVGRLAGGMSATMVVWPPVIGAGGHRSLMYSTPPPHPFPGLVLTGLRSDNVLGKPVPLYGLGDI